MFLEVQAELKLIHGNLPGLAGQAADWKGRRHTPLYVAP
jgi:hypothetical protein